MHPAGHECLQILLKMGSVLDKNDKRFSWQTSKNISTHPKHFELRILILSPRMFGGF